MTILYLAYWGVKDGLTVSVVYPHLELLQEKEEIDKIIFVTIEREGAYEKKLDPRFNHKVVHQPLFSKNLSIGLINKINDFLIFPKQLKKILIDHQVDLAFTHGMVSGSLTHLVCPKLNIPYYVFAEPHSEYMLEAGVWKKQDPRYIFQKKWEDGQLNTASGIFSVTENYIQRINKEYPKKVSEKAYFAPNAVDLNLFAFNADKRAELRAQLGLTDKDVVGIYVGKFGGIYLEEKAFEIFKTGDALIPNMKLIILSPQEKETIMTMANTAGYDKEFLVTKVPHDEVKNYLFAADFGISVQNPKPSNLFLCPLKNGEYWAAGLPIFSIKDVGDDTRRIEADGALGAIFELDNQESIKHAFGQIHSLIEAKTDRLNNAPRKAAESFKNIEMATALIDKALGH
jgi:hypothetical protein